MPVATNSSDNASNAYDSTTTDGNAATARSRGHNRPLNPALRPQRLFHKVEIAMKAVDKKLFDKKVTGLSDWLTDHDMVDFRRTIRYIVRTKYDATFDSWPKRVMHNYVPDAREAIEQAINERWDLFDATSSEDLYDDFVPSELLYPLFYSQ